MKFKGCYFFITLLCLFLIPRVNAGVVVGGTRVIFDGKKKETSLSVSNPDKEPYLIQSWIEDRPQAINKIAFIITPPLFRLDGYQENMLRIVRIGNDFPQDRESLYWLNIKSIPSADTAESTNTLQIAVKTRIKLIYRPSALRSQVPEDVTSKLKWQRAGNSLTLTNPTPYYMNFQYVRLAGKAIKEIAFIAPMSTESFTVPTSAAATVSWKLINDYGGTGEEHQAGI